MIPEKRREEAVREVQVHVGTTAMTRYSLLQEVKCVWASMFVVLLVLGIDCHSHTGSLNDTCNADGTCNGTNLTCTWSAQCRPKDGPAGPPDPSRCYDVESVCFCRTCATQCGSAGMLNCLYQDTSVWGSKPATCECKK